MAACKRVAQQARRVVFAIPGLIESYLQQIFIGTKRISLSFKFYAVVGVRIETIFHHQALHQQPKCGEITFMFARGLLLNPHIAENS
jgi:hypothetical protein